MRIARIAIPVLAAALAAAAGCDSSPDAGAVFRGKVFSQPQGPLDFSAPNWDGSTFRLEDHRGKVVLLAFGFTSCPDICPFTLRRFAKVTQNLGVRAGDVTVAFVSVDPERDTLEKLKTYVSAFDASFFGLRPVGPAMAGLLKDYKVKATKQVPRTGGGYYAVDHTGDVFVIDRSGRLRLTHPHDTSTEALLADVQKLLDEPSP